MTADGAIKSRVVHDQAEKVLAAARHYRVGFISETELKIIVDIALDVCYSIGESLARHSFTREQKQQEEEK